MFMSNQDIIDQTLKMNKSPQNVRFGSIALFWSPAILLSIVFLPVGIAIISLLFGFIHGGILIGISERNPIRFIRYVLIDFACIWIIPVFVGQLNCLYLFSPFGTSCMNGLFNFGYVIISGIEIGVIFLLIYILSFNSAD